MIHYHALLSEIRQYMEKEGDVDSDRFLEYDSQATRPHHVHSWTGKKADHHHAIDKLSDALAVRSSELVPDRVPFSSNDSGWTFNTETEQFEKVDDFGARVATGRVKI